MVIKEDYPALIIGDDSFINALHNVLDTPQLSCNDITRAKQIINHQCLSYIMIQQNILDIDTINFLKMIATTTLISILIFVNPEKYDILYYQLNEYNIFVCHYPSSIDTMHQTFMTIKKSRDIILKLEKKYKTLQQKFLQHKTIEQCKMMLIQYHDLSEEEAHHYILKTAMNNAITKYQAAKTIIASLNIKIDH